MQLETRPLFECHYQMEKTPFVYLLLKGLDVAFYHDYIFLKLVYRLCNLISFSSNCLIKSHLVHFYFYLSFIFLPVAVFRFGEILQIYLELQFIYFSFSKLYSSRCLLSFISFDSCVTK